MRNWRKMDAHVRRRLRAIVIRQKKRPRHPCRHLLSRDVSARKAAMWMARDLLRVRAALGLAGPRISGMYWNRIVTPTSEHEPRRGLRNEMQHI